MLVHVLPVFFPLSAIDWIVLWIQAAFFWCYTWLLLLPRVGYGQPICLPHLFSDNILSLFPFSLQLQTASPRCCYFDMLGVFLWRTDSQWVVTIEHTAHHAFDSFKLCFFFRLFSLLTHAPSCLLSFPHPSHSLSFSSRGGDVHPLVVMPSVSLLDVRILVFLFCHYYTPSSVVFHFCAWKWVL